LERKVAVRFSRDGWSVAFEDPVKASRIWSLQKGSERIAVEIETGKSDWGATWRKISARALRTF